jgi:hypothetical protein
VLELKGTCYSFHFFVLVEEISYLIFLEALLYLFVLGLYNVFLIEQSVTLYCLVACIWYLFLHLFYKTICRKIIENEVPLRGQPRV